MQNGRLWDLYQCQKSMKHVLVEHRRRGYAEPPDVAEGVKQRLGGLVGIGRAVERIERDDPVRRVEVDDISPPSRRNVVQEFGDARPVRIEKNSPRPAWIASIA